MNEKNKPLMENILSEGMKKVVEKQLELAKDAFVTGGDIETLRENYNKERKFWNDGGYKPERITELKCKVEGGYINIRGHYPKNHKVKGPCIIYIHGGGFATGSNDTHSLIMRMICEESEKVVFGIEYRLAPEYKMPTQINDCVAAIDYIINEAEELDIDKNNIIIAGDSAGASLAMIMNLYYRDERGDNSFIRGLMLYYGQYGNNEAASKYIFGNELDGMRKEDLDYYRSILIDKPGDFMKYLDMFELDLVSNMPKTYIACGGIDPLRDESILLYDILKGHKIPVKLDIFDGLLHSFLQYSKMLNEAKIAIENGVKFIF